MNESDLMQAIEAYTKRHKRMPTKVRGTFLALIEIGKFASYIENPSTGFWTPLGILSLELDADASDFYVA